MCKWMLLCANELFLLCATFEMYVRLQSKKTKLIVTSFNFAADLRLKLSR